MIGTSEITKEEARVAETTAPKKAGAVSLDFSNVREKSDSVWNTKRVKEGPYKAKIIAVYDAPTKETREPQWAFAIELQTSDRVKGVYPYRVKLVENQLWKLRNLGLACGISIPRRKINVDPQKFVGKFLAVEMVDDDYKDKERSSVNDVFPLKELEESGELETSEDEDGEEYEDEEYEDEEYEQGAPPDDDEDDEEDDEEEPEEEPAPPARRTRPKPKPQEVSDDDLESLDIDDI